MKKIFIMAAIAFGFAACKKEVKVESDKTVIETPSDTTSIDTDTVSDAEIEMEEDAADAAPQADKAPAVEVRAAKDMKVEYASFGDKIVADKALSQADMLKKYSSLKPGDTVNIKFKSNIKDVCQKKGCWMSLELPNGKESFVKFKDYAFFVPLNAAQIRSGGNGKAFVSEISIAQLKHYAKDGGKSEAEIAQITEPKRTYGFLADGVLISKK